MKTCVKKILINGDFLSRRLTGIERFAYEITSRLDKLSDKDEIAIAIPSSVEDVPAFKNLQIIKLKKKGGSATRWQLFSLQGFLLKHREYTALDFGNFCLPFTPGIVFLHDIYCELFPKDFKSRREVFERFYSRLLYRVIIYRAKKIISVSNYSRNIIASTFHLDPESISVIYNGWEHLKNVNSDNSVFTDYPELLNPFYFFLGSLSRRKNIKWIIEYASKNPAAHFVIAGGSLKIVKVDELFNSLPSNITLPGYLDDGKVKALMEKCKALILPSYYEGFGIPPLEALSCGAQIIVANAACLPEIYGNTAHYIDPFNTDIDLDKLIKEPVDPPDEILIKYSHDVSARKLYELIKQCQKKF